MKTKSNLFFLLCFSILIGHAQISADYIDDFENGTTQNWTDGGNTTNPPSNVNTGGPNGANDNFLQDLSAGGNGAGSKMIMFNDQQWNGNYTNQGIVAIKFHAKALTNTLNLRVAFDGAGGRICTTNAVSVLAGGAWQEYIIPISSSDFTTVAGGTNIGQTLADVSDMRILSNSSPSWQGEAIAATLQIDNILASSTLGVDDLESAASFIIYPNPIKSILNIELNENIYRGSITIYDFLGKKILTKRFGSETIESIDSSNWDSGLYLIEIEINNRREIKRLVKH